MRTRVDLLCISERSGSVAGLVAGRRGGWSVGGGARGGPPSAPTIPTLRACRGGIKTPTLTIFT